MTTEDDFQRALDADPTDWQTRLVFADWLQERGDPRAEGYRALGRLKVVPFWYGESTKPAWIFWNIDRYGTVFSRRREGNDIDRAMLPGDWHALMTTGHREGASAIGFDIRREAEDAAALAFAELPAARRAELLSTAPSPVPQ